MPYRIDVNCPAADAFDVLAELGALDIEQPGETLAAILPDSVSIDVLSARLGNMDIRVSAAVGRDDGSVWMLSSRPVHAGGMVISTAPNSASAGALQLVDSDAFGTGHHPSTALCLEATEEIVRIVRPACLLDVGTGSGILALAGLRMGVPRAVGIDIDGRALAVAAENARLNDLSDRLELVLGGPDAVPGQWPLVVANVLASPLIELAPVLVRCLGAGGWLVLSGIHESLEAEVRRAYTYFGVRGLQSRTLGGWTAITAQAPW